MQVPLNFSYLLQENHWDKWHMFSMDQMSFTTPQKQQYPANTHTHTTILLLFWNLSGTTRVSRYQKGKTGKGKTNLDLLEQEIVSGSDMCWAICKSAPHPRQPRQHPTTQFFTGQMPFLPPNQQRQSTEGKQIQYCNKGKECHTVSRA